MTPRSCAQSLVRPASAARALNNGALYIERPDMLVQLIAKQKGLSHPVIDGIVALVNSRLDANRKKGCVPGAATHHFDARERFLPSATMRKP